MRSSSARDGWRNCGTYGGPVPYGHQVPLLVTAFHSQQFQLVLPDVTTVVPGVVQANWSLIGVVLVVAVLSAQVYGQVYGISQRA
jgi:hypothetical protein